MNIRATVIAFAQAAALFAAGLVVPVAGQLLSLFSPVPLILVSVRYGLPEGAAALAAATALISLIAGWQAGAVLLLGFGLMAAGISLGMRRGWKPEYPVILGGILPVAAAAVPLAWYFHRTATSPVAAVEAYLRNSIQEAVKIYTSMGLSDMAAAVSGMSDVFIHYFVRLLPGIVVATFVVQAACCYAVARILIARRRGPRGGLAPQTTLAQWHAPDVWVWGLIGALGCVIVPNEAARFSGLNVVVLALVVYTVQGMACVDFLLQKAHVGAPVRSVILVVILALPSVMFLPPLGVVDIWADFRKVRTHERKT